MKQILELIAKRSQISENLTSSKGNGAKRNELFTSLDNINEEMRQVLDQKGLSLRSDFLEWHNETTELLEVIDSSLGGILTMDWDDGKDLMIKITKSAYSTWRVTGESGDFIISVFKVLSKENLLPEGNFDPKKHLAKLTENYGPFSGSWLNILTMNWKQFHNYVQSNEKPELHKRNFDVLFMKFPNILGALKKMTVQ